MEEVPISGFYVVARLDRDQGANAGFGGVAVYARQNFTGIVFLNNSLATERVWCILHTHFGKIVLGNLYRAPDAGLDSIYNLPKEIDQHKHHGIGTLLCGDMNIHHQRRLRFSNGSTPLGSTMMALC